MRTDFTPDNMEIWIDNWKRNDVIGNVVCRSFLESFPFEKINVIVNHPSVTIDNFPEDIKHKIKLWPNIMRHPLSRGPITKNINQAYIHTFLSGKKYCIVAHDSYVATKGWSDCIVNSDMDAYFAPQGDGFHVMTLDGLKIFGWWDEMYTTMGWHEIDMLCRVLRKAFVQKQGKASIVDYHGLWPTQLPFVERGSYRLIYNSVGLEKYIQRLDKNRYPQIGERLNNSFTVKAEKWHRRKWPHPFDTINGYNHGQGTYLNLMQGPTEENIVDFYPWLDLTTLIADRTSY